MWTVSQSIGWRCLRGEDRAQHAQLARSAGSGHRIGSDHGRGGDRSCRVPCTRRARSGRHPLPPRHGRRRGQSFSRRATTTVQVTVLIDPDRRQADRAATRVGRRLPARSSRGYGRRGHGAAASGAVVCVAARVRIPGMPKTIGIVKTSHPHDNGACQRLQATAHGVSPCEVEQAMPEGAWGDRSTAPGKLTRPAAIAVYPESGSRGGRYLLRDLVRRAVLSLSRRSRRVRIDDDLAAHERMHDTEVVIGSRRLEA